MERESVSSSWFKKQPLDGVAVAESQGRKEAMAFSNEKHIEHKLGNHRPCVFGRPRLRRRRWTASFAVAAVAVAAAAAAAAAVAAVAAAAAAAAAVAAAGGGGVAAAAVVAAGAGAVAVVVAATAAAAAAAAAAVAAAMGRRVGPQGARIWQRRSCCQCRETVPGPWSARQA